MVDEHAAEAAVAEKRAAERSDLGRGEDPARRLEVELVERLEVAVLVFGEELDAHVGGDVEGAVFGAGGFSGFEGFAVVAEAPAAGRTFRRAVEEKVLAGLFVAADDVGLAAGPLHLAQRPELIRAGFKPRLYLSPLDALVPVHVFFEPVLQDGDQLLAAAGG